MRARQVLIGAGSLLLGVLFLLTAFVWWTVGGITAAMDSPDGEPSGPLHGYGVLAVLIVSALALLFVGARRLGRGRMHSA